MGRSSQYFGALRGGCADLHSRCAKGPQGYCWTEASDHRTEAFTAVSKGLSTERNRLGTSEVRRVTTGGRCHSAVEAHSAASRKRLATRRVRTLQTLKAVVNSCAWGLRDSQGSLLNQSWQILTTSPDVQRVLNHRSCDQRHKHGRLPDHFSAFHCNFLNLCVRRWRSSFL